ncbi:MAG: acyl carrier protein [Proteobacteria bacterium]|jgi:acyl carrier protein|nr:acyl carrier protein [Pseudomonadota bacterium]
MSQPTDLKQSLKVMIVDSLMLQVGPEAIADDAPLFGPTGLGLDSVDALQLVVSLEKNYGLKIADTSEAKKILQSVNTIAATLTQLDETRRAQPPRS